MEEYGMCIRRFIQKKDYSIQVKEASDLQVKFSGFCLRPFANWVLNKKYSYFLQLERILENNLIHNAHN